MVLVAEYNFEMKRMWLSFLTLLLLTGCSSSTKTHEFLVKDAPQKTLLYGVKSFRAGEVATIKVELMKGVTYREVLQVSSGDTNVLGTLVDPNNANPDAFSFSPGATNAHTFTAQLNGSYSFTYRYEKPTVTGVVRWWFLTEGVKDVSVGTATDVLLKQ